jgi:hypothetical protein
MESFRSVMHSVHGDILSDNCRWSLSVKQLNSNKVYRSDPCLRTKGKKKLPDFQPLRRIWRVKT